MTTITDFIEARLAADEVAAKAAAEQDNEGESWRVRKVRDDGMFVWGEHQAIPPNGKGERLGLLDDAQTRFVESHDPARVLRQVAMVRAMMRHAEEASRMDCQIEGGWGVGARDLVNDPVIDTLMHRDIAAIWSDHPDFQPEWAEGHATS